MSGGLIEGISAGALWDGIKASGKRLFGNGIVITSPRPQETVSGVEKLGASNSYPVRGTLKHLPHGHKIWLLTQNDGTGDLWPQGFFPVQHDPGRGTWMGKISWIAPKEVRIIAVVAPPTSQDLFQYFQVVGAKRNSIFEPLKRVPPECRNQASVQAFIP